MFTLFDDEHCIIAGGNAHGGPVSGGTVSFSHVELLISQPGLSCKTDRC